MISLKALSTRIKSYLAAALVVVLASGCASQGAGPKESAGALIGAGIGGLAGAHVGRGEGRLVAVAAGTLAGALIGGEIGRSLDRADQAYLTRAQAEATAAPVGDTIHWHNPDSGNGGRVTPTRDGYDRRSGAYCREYYTEIFIDGEWQDAYGVSCRQPDGRWKVVSAE